MSTDFSGTTTAFSDSVKKVFDYILFFVQLIIGIVSSSTDMINDTVDKARNISASTTQADGE